MSKTLYQKLFELQTVMGEFEWEKDGVNRHQSYKYISEAQYKANFKRALKKVGLIWQMTENIGERQFIATLGDNSKMHMIITSHTGNIIDPENGEKISYTFSGSGQDNGDKAIYKAYTGALKYFIASNFNVGEDNDPERDDYTTPEKEEQSQPKVKREEAKKELVGTEGPASQLQIDTLKKQLNQLQAIDQSQNGFVTEILERTKNFTMLNKKQCEKLILNVDEMIRIANGG